MRYVLTDAVTRIAYDRRGRKPKRAKLVIANNIATAPLRPIRVHREEFVQGDRTGSRIDAGVNFSDDLAPWQGEWWATLDDGSAGPYEIDVDDEQES